MKKHFHVMVILSIIWSMILLLTACNQTETNQAPGPIFVPSQTYEITPTQTPTAKKMMPPQFVTDIPSTTPGPTSTFISSAPKDAVLDETCRMTINFFFSYKRGMDSKAFRNLFVTSSQYLADSYKPLTEARILLKLMPASQEWQQDFPGTPMPGAIIPEESDEYIYYVEFTGHYGPNETPVAYYYPDFWTIHMIAKGPDSCKIKSYGKG